MKRSQILRSSSTREPAEQVWPAFCTIALTTEVSAASRSASANTICGDFPPSSSVQPIWLRAAAVCTSVPDLGAAGEREEIDAGMGGERRARLLAEARHDVERALGKAGFGREFRQPQRREAGVLGRLHHARVADRERRRRSVRPNIWLGIVPGNDVAGDALAARRRW